MIASIVYHWMYPPINSLPVVFSYSYNRLEAGASMNSDQFASTVDASVLADLPKRRESLNWTLSFSDLRTPPPKPIRKPRRKRTRRVVVPFIPQVIPCSDIQFYDWGDSISLIDCSLLPRLQGTL